MKILLRHHLQTYTTDLSKLVTLKNTAANSCYGLSICHLSLSRRCCCWSR